MIFFIEFRYLLEKTGDIHAKKTDHCLAIDRYYDDHIIQVENTGPPVQGKSQLRAMELDNLEGVYAVATQFGNVVIDESTGMVWGEMIIRFQSKKSGYKRLEEAFLQKWVNGKIVWQRFYYGDVVDDSEITTY